MQWDALIIQATQEAEPRGPQVQGKPELHKWYNGTLSKNNNNKTCRLSTEGLQLLRKF
jgi:hypothetical protein